MNCNWPGHHLFLLLVMTVASCAADPIAFQPPVEFLAANYSRIFHDAVDVLRDEGFRIDRQDFRFGHVTTWPLPAPTAFEPWEQTHTTLDQALESTVNHQRRVVRVTLDPVGGGISRKDFYLLRVEATIQRLAVPTRQLTGSTDGPFVFATLRSVPTELAMRTITSAYWTDVARDGHLEHRLLTEILHRSTASRGDDHDLPSETDAPPTESLEDMP